MVTDILFFAAGAASMAALLIAAHLVTINAIKTALIATEGRIVSAIKAKV